VVVFWSGPSTSAGGTWEGSQRRGVPSPTRPLSLSPHAGVSVLVLRHNQCQSHAQTPELQLKATPHSKLRPASLVLDNRALAT